MEKYRLVELRDNIEKLMECPICLDRLQAPVVCCYNGHPLCRTCAPNSRQCPLCQREFTTGQNTFINQMVNSFPFKCKYSIEGCKERAAPEYLVIHEKKCDYRYADCPLLTENNTPCTLTGQISILNYVNHVKDDHASYITALNGEDWTYKNSLPQAIFQDRLNCYYSVIKDTARKLYFMLMIYYDTVTKTYQITLHHLGKDADASKYIFSVKLSVKGHIEGMYYSAKCLPNVMSPEEAKRYDPLEIKDTDGRISKNSEKSPFEVSVKSVKEFEEKNPYKPEEPVRKKFKPKTMDACIIEEKPISRPEKEASACKGSPLWAPYQVVDVSP